MSDSALPRKDRKEYHVRMKRVRPTDGKASTTRSRSKAKSPKSRDYEKYDDKTITHSTFVTNTPITPDGADEVIMQRLLNTVVDMKKRELVRQRTKLPETTKADLIEWCDELDRWKMDLWNKIVKKRRDFSSPSDLGAVCGMMDGMLDHVT